MLSAFFRHLRAASHFTDAASTHADRRGVACWPTEVDVAGEATALPHRVRRSASAVHLGMMLLDAKGVPPMLRRMAT